MSFLILLNVSRISIRAPARGATIEVQRDEVGIIDFNSRSREGSDASLSGIFLVFCKFQSALPQGERRQEESGWNPCNTISIRAPARGATRCISCHLVRTLSFQSALPRGERQSPFAYFRSRYAISILAPARGATVEAAEHFHMATISILAPARGATPPYPAYSWSFANFNPRSREGSDFHIPVQYSAHPVISILAPARGATESNRAQVTRAAISILAPARGATLSKIRIISAFLFQSSLPRGERRCFAIF